MSASKYMTYNNSLFNVSSFLQSSSSSHHSPSSTSSCSSSSSNSFSPNSSINAHSQCLPASLSHSALLTPTAPQSGSRYLSNSTHLPFPSGFSASPSSFLRSGSPSPTDLQSLSRLTLAQAQLAAVVAGNGNAPTTTSGHHESSSQTTSVSPQVTSLALKQAALAAALQARQQANSSASSSSTNQLLNGERLEQPLLASANAGQPFTGSNYSPPSKSSFSPPKSFYYNSLKSSSSAFQQTTSGSPNLEIMNLSPQAYGGPNGCGSFHADGGPTRAPQLDPSMTRNHLTGHNSPESKLLGATRSSPIQLTNLDALPDHKSGKRAANRQGKAVRNKSNHKDEFGFSKVLKGINLFSVLLCAPPRCHFLFCVCVRSSSKLG